MGLTDEAIVKIRELIVSGQLQPGAKLPPEKELCAQLGMSRSSMREAVKALEVARVLAVRHGDGTYVTSLEPRLLLEGIGFAVDLLRDDTVLEVLEVRRMLEPEATALAALRIDDTTLDTLHGHLDDMREAGHDAEALVAADAAFHQCVISACGNQTLVSVLNGLSRRTLRARVWRGIVQDEAIRVTVEQHAAIYEALAARDPQLARAAALLHVATSERGLRVALSSTADDE
jgi:GntR family transcriptional regulator, transcriptional repressor for pyruvate dehydrogenase complex